MNIVDSSCWLEYLMNSVIGEAVAPVVENPHDLVVPTITLYEVYKKLAAEKGDEYAVSVVSYMRTGTVVDLDADLSIFAAQTSKKYDLAMADSIIYATALKYACLVWTADKHFKDIPNVRYFPK